MSDHWENVTDNVEALWIWLLKMPAPKVSEGTPQMLITSLDFSAFTGRIAIGRLERGVLKEGTNLISKEMVLIKISYKELHTLKVLVVKKYRSYCRRYLCIVELKDLKLVILSLILKIQKVLKQLISMSLQ
jgi:GTP-binding protein